MEIRDYTGETDQESSQNPLCYLTEKTLFTGLSEATANIYLFKRDMESGYSVWSKNAAEYFGLPEGYENHVSDVWIPKVHPEDRRGYEADLQAVFSGQKDFHHYQYRALNARGEYVWLECDGKVTLDEASGKRVFTGLISRLDIIGKFDPITNCLNIKEFYMTRYKNRYILLLIGIDKFRKVINQIGFSQSNQILVTLGNVLQKHCDVQSIFRMTGDEFLILLPEQSMEEVEFFFQQILSEFQGRVLNEQMGLNVTFSGGASYFQAEDSKDAAIRKLENCLDYAKAQGQGVFARYSARVEEKREHNIQLKKALRHAILHNFEGFYLVYQPIVTSKTQILDGAECLLRFYTEELGVVSPMEFIPLLEESGDIIPVGRWVAETAIRQKAEWNPICPGLRIGFNVSILQLRDRALTEYIVKLIKQYEIKPDEIIVELTESKRMSNPDRMRDVLQPLVDAGVWIFLDDFGMNASNFELVKELDVNGIKIDHSFVRGMANTVDEKTQRLNLAIASSITSLGKSLGLRVIVEGVETAQIDEMIHSMHIQYVQGYYYSRPVKKDEFETGWILGKLKKAQILPERKTDVKDAYPNLSLAELHILTRQLAKVYDVVRLVDVGLMRVITYDASGKRLLSHYSCHDVWGRDERCKNCISAMAFREKNRVAKFEFIGHDIYHVTSQYIVVNGEPCVLEIVEKNSDQTLFGAFGKNKFVESIRSYFNQLYTDSLSQVNNRKNLDEQLYGLDMDAIAMIDIDNFKCINDCYGHICGDKVIHDVAQIIRNNVRTEDNVVRYGGDEFIISFTIMKRECLFERLEAIRKTVEEHIHIENEEQEVRVTLSIGAAYGRRSVKELLPVADRALYDAKKQKNKVAILESEHE